MIVEIILSVTLGTVFLSSAWAKLRHPKSFLLVVLENRMLSPALSKIYGLLLPPLEFLLALLILAGIVVRLTAIVMSLLLASFIVAAGVNIIRGREIDCGCFGALKHRKTGRRLLIQDGVLLEMSIVLAIAASSWGGLESWSVFYLLGIKQGIPLVVVGIGLILYAMIFLRRSMPKKMHTRENLG